MTRQARRNPVVTAVLWSGDEASYGCHGTRVSLIERFGEHLGGAVLGVAHRDAPRSAADLAVFHVLLHRASAGVEPELVGLPAVRTHDQHLALGRAVAEREVLVIERIDVRIGGRHHREPYTEVAPFLSKVRM